MQANRFRHLGAIARTAAIALFALTLSLLAAGPAAAGQDGVQQSGAGQEGVQLDGAQQGGAGQDGAGQDPAAGAATGSCERVITAEVVALDQPFFLNRLGAAMPGGMIFALERDVVATGGGDALEPGRVTLREDTRPRPLVLRMNVGDCLEVRFTNLLAAEAVANPFDPQPTPWPNQTTTREAGLHVQGMQVVGSIASDGSWVGANTSSLALPGESRIYMFYAGAEGVFFVSSPASNFQEQGSGGPGGQLTAGLFGSMNVQPRGAEWYRSQVTREDMLLASRDASGNARTTPGGQPIIDYAALYPADYPDASRRCTPILKMLDDPYEVDGGACTAVEGGNPQIYHGDLTAVITGPGAGRFPYSEDAPQFYENPASPDRRQPYREITVMYHEALTAIQAFPDFYSPLMKSTLSNGGDKFAINYGAGGIGAEILANRLGVGPMADCQMCKFEEFFLTSWAVGDPAMVVDVPANASLPASDETWRQSGLLDAFGLGHVTSPPDVAEGTRVPAGDGSFDIEPLFKATKALYPDDPSNVYHSYLRDHVKMRVLHAGAKLTHVHHLHAHQWLHSPNSDNGHYLDSQMINPGATYTTEIAFAGSGNLNLTVGDSIFHCHFYPHFAAGMWSLWRVHDAFEAGTELDANGVPVSGEGVWNRALPDGEIAEGTPVPALVPLPTLTMAPMPARVRVIEAIGDDGQRVGYIAEVNEQDLAAGLNPGFPFFVPGVAGHRPPHPPLDFALNPDHDPSDPASRQHLDGGLPRHVVVEGSYSHERHNQWDFTKDNETIFAWQVPEEGTAVEQVAMAAHERRYHDSYKPDGTPGQFVLNGMPRAQGAPFANPGVDIDGNPVGESRVYKGANVQMDVVFNKKGWHFPQQRIITLWEDVADTLDGSRRPEPFFIRANSNEVIEYWHTNLVPDYYELDDFQVRTPTDILGQHIHLVKFDVTSSDGAANGFNYEDGTYSPDEVRKRIAGIRRANNCTDADSRNGSFACPVATPAPAVFGPPPANQDWTGAQTTVQRWYTDPLLNNLGEDRTLRTVFTHDHFSPSTHQQAGFYAGLLVEPESSVWRDPVTGEMMGGRDDGGPTSWRADILTADPADSYREFMVEFQDLALAYDAGSKQAWQFVEYDPDYPVDANGLITAATPLFGWADPQHAINRPNAGAGQNPGNLATLPQIISAAGFLGTYTVNYRNEPVPFRVNPNPANRASLTPEQQAMATDLSFSLSSIERLDADLNRQPTGPINPAATPPPGYRAFAYSEPFEGAGPFDPYTPLMRAYENDKVQLRVLVGAHMLPHFFSLEGLKWLSEPSEPNSGYRATQGMGISEHFELNFTMPPVDLSGPSQGYADYLYSPGSDITAMERGLWGLIRSYDRAATRAGGAAAGPAPDLAPNLLPLPNNPTGSAPPDAFGGCPFGAPVRSVHVTATTSAQALPGGVLVYNSRGAGPAGSRDNEPIADPDALIYVYTSDLDAGGRLREGVRVEPLILRAAAGECVEVTLANGFDTTATGEGGNRIFTETFNVGGVQLTPSSRVGLHAQLLSYDVTRNNGTNIGVNPDQTIGPGQTRTYRWYAGNVEIGEDGVSRGIPVEFGAVTLLPSDPIEQDPRGLVGALIIEPQGSWWREDAGTRASATVFTPDGGSFRDFVMVLQNDLDGAAWATSGTGGTSGKTSQTVNYRTEPANYRYGQAPSNLAAYTSNALVAADPQTPVFAAAAGSAVRFRIVHPRGTGDGQNITIHGHEWQEEPWTHDSTVIGDNPRSQVLGSMDTGANNNLNVVLGSAGGEMAVPGDYLYRTFMEDQFEGGMWGILRVGEPDRDTVTITLYDATGCRQDPGDGRVCVEGVNTVNLETGRYAPQVLVRSPDRADGSHVVYGTADVDPTDGTWSFTLPQPDAPALVVVTSFGSGTATIPFAGIPPEIVEQLRDRPEAADPAANYIRVERAVQRGGGGGR